MHKFKNPASGTDVLAENCKKRASIAMQTLDRHSKVFTASKVGQVLLQQIAVEISGGQVTMDMVREQMEEDHEFIAVQNPNVGLFQHIVKDGMSKSTKIVLNEPGKCAGTMMQPDGM
jgi:hypothetical protein